MCSLLFPDVRVLCQTAKLQTSTLMSTTASIVLEGPIVPPWMRTKLRRRANSGFLIATFEVCGHGQVSHALDNELLFDTRATGRLVQALDEQPAGAVPSKLVEAPLH